MSVDARLLDLLVCPVCKGPLTLERDTQRLPHELVCPADRLAFPIRDGIPVMLDTEARALDPTARPAA
ncbi:MAG: Trm112 family protein [Aquabacterium sp.]